VNAIIANRDSASQDKKCVFTIGHSNHDEPTFVNLLKKHQIDVVADVRSQPYARYATHFNADQIQPALTEAGIRYVFLGRQLGGRPDGPDFYDADGHVLYDRVAVSTPFEQGIERLIKGVERYRVAIMCGEENPLECHRNLLVGRVLAQRGIEVWHIRGDGRLQQQIELDREATTGNPHQQSLFEELEDIEVQPWKSIRSALPKPQPPDSSAS